MPIFSTLAGLKVAEKFVVEGWWGGSLGYNASGFELSLVMLGFDKGLW